MSDKFWSEICSENFVFVSQVSADGNELTLTAGVFSLDGSEALILTEKSLLVEPTKPPSPP